ncbi:MAG: NAD(P)H-hydrate dehydratase [Pseudomonadota bacterium]
MEFETQALLERGLLTPVAMAAADQRTIDSGTARGTLIARAARAAFRVLRAQFTRRPVTVLCGPGQNGEDGWMLAALLADAGWPLEIIDLGGGLQIDDAAPEGLASYVRPSGVFDPAPTSLVVDAVLGAGLARPVTGEIAHVFEKLNKAEVQVLAIDLPSGIDGATGEARGQAVEADVTVTFHRLKPGHLLGDGADHAGRIFLCDIGIAPEAEDMTAVWNAPCLWKDGLRGNTRETHKYARGHVCVIGGPGLQGGAARLSARAASVSGAGAVTYLSPLSGAEFAAASFDAVMVKPLGDREALDAFLKERVGAVVLGPGMGHADKAEIVVETVLETKLPCVLDADALTLYEGRTEEFFDRLHGDCVLTPHEGEFSRLFPDLKGDKRIRTEKAAELSGATVLLKGSTTVIAKTGKPTVISSHGGPELATAGSGDVLAGLIGGFLAKGMTPVKAAAAGAWVHADAARGASPSLNADHLPARIVSVMDALTG